jgi:hypothetical protein
MADTAAVLNSPSSTGLKGWPVAEPTVFAIDQPHIETRRVGCKTVYRVKGSNVWVWSEKQAIEWHNTYGETK